MSQDAGGQYLTQPQAETVDILYKALTEGLNVVLNEARGYGKTETCVELLHRLFSEVCCRNAV
jgi:hypothetical protein